jgi:hypothetical protein
MTRRRAWDQSDDEYLRENYTKISSWKLGRNLDRDQKAIKNRLRKLGLMEKQFKDATPRSILRGASLPHDELYSPPGWTLESGKHPCTVCPQWPPTAFCGRCSARVDWCRSTG